MSPHTDLIDRLLAIAQGLAAAALENQPATTDNLHELASLVKVALKRQVAFGWWKDLGITEWPQLADLKVTCVPGSTLVGEPPIKVEYDFARTALPTVVVKSVRGS